MKDAEGQPVNVPGNDTPNIVTDTEGIPVVPQGTEEPMSEAPKETMPRPAPAPQMPDQAQETISETVNQQAVQGTITYEELAAKKGFGSVDDLAKAYSNLESQNKKVEVTLADAIRARQESTETVQDAVQAVQDNDNDEALTIVNRLIDKKVGAVKDTFDYQMHLMQNPEDKAFTSQAIKYVRENPGIKWDVAFKAAKADSLPQLERERGKQEAYQSIGQKQAGQAMHGQTVREPAMDAEKLIEGIKTGKVPLAAARKIINSAQA